jgi:hypothetical protein
MVGDIAISMNTCKNSPTMGDYNVKLAYHYVMEELVDNNLELSEIG